MNTRKLMAGEKRRLLDLQEDHFHDVKSSKIKPSVVQQSFVSFANTDGGELFIGIEDKKVSGERIVGYDSVEDANSVVEVLLHQTKPSVDNVLMEFIDCGSNGFVLYIDIPKSHLVHYTADGGCYSRVSASKRKLTADQIMRLGYGKGQYSYEDTTANGADLDNILSGSYLESYLSRVKVSMDPSSFLRKQGIVTKDSTPKVACVLLFDDEPQASLTTRCAIKVYRLRTTQAEYKREQLDGKPTTIEGPIEEQINKVIQTVDDILKGASYQVGGNVVKLAYPSSALKEILVNAVIHRDYSLNDDIHVKIYDDRVEIHSPGRLPGYITIDNMLEERYSRNPRIVRLLHKLPDPPNHDIGEGLNTAFNEMRKAGLVEPQIEELGNSVVVKVRHQKLASLEDQILDFLRDHPTVTNKDIRKLTGEESENKVKKAFQRLREKGEIEPIDPKALPFKFKYRKVDVR